MSQSSWAPEKTTSFQILANTLMPMEVTMQTFLTGLVYLQYQCFHKLLLELIKGAKCIENAVKEGGVTPKVQAKQAH